MREFWSFLKALTFYWWGFMGSAAFTILSLIATVLNWRTVYLSWAMGSLAILFLFAGAFHAWRKEHREKLNLQRLEQTAEVPADAPQLLLAYQQPKRHEGIRLSQERFVYINGGGHAIIDPVLGPLTWEEQASIQQMSGIGVVLPGQQEEREIWIESSKPRSDLYGFMRSNTPHTADTSVTVNYRDHQGREYARDFVLTTEADGRIICRPGLVRLVQQRP